MPLTADYPRQGRRVAPKTTGTRPPGKPVHHYRIYVPPVELEAAHTLITDNQPPPDPQISKSPTRRGVISTAP
jgi:hypothetical protein